MAGGGPELRRGRIARASVRNHNGFAKDRPVIILTPTAEIGPDEAFEAMAIPTTFPDPPPADHIPLPWHLWGRVGTRLRRRSAAVVTWLCELHPDEVTELGGDVPVR